MSRDLDLDLDLGSGHTAYRRASLIDLYLHTKFHRNWKNFLWTDVRTDGHQTHIIRSNLWSRPKNNDGEISSEFGPSCHFCQLYIRLHIIVMCGVHTIQCIMVSQIPSYHCINHRRFRSFKRGSYCFVASCLRLNVSERNLTFTTTSKHHFIDLDLPQTGISDVRRYYFNHDQKVIYKKDGYRQQNVRQR